ncbi:two-component sensor histidine kinase, partial [Rhizobium ruizarguesonis]
IAAIIEIIETYPQNSDYSEIVLLARDQLSLHISIEPDGDLPPPRVKPFFSILDGILIDEITDEIHRPFWLRSVSTRRILLSSLMRISTRFEL